MIHSEELFWRAWHFDSIMQKNFSRRDKGGYEIFKACPEEIFKYIIHSGSFREQIIKGEYVYYDSSLYTPSAFVCGEGFGLTEDAKLHPEKYCLCIKNVEYVGSDIYINPEPTFALTYRGYKAYEEYEKSNECTVGLDFGTCYSAAFGSSGKFQEPQHVCWESSVFFALPQSNNKENIDAFTFEKYAEEIRNLPNDFNGTLKYFCDKSHMPLEEIAHRAGMSDRNLRRIISDKEHQPKLESVVAICIALHLFPLFSNSLILKAGYTLRDNNRGIAYQMLLNMFYMNDIETCNMVLKSMGLSPLAKEDY